MHTVCNCSEFDSDFIKEINIDDGTEDRFDEINTITHDKPEPNGYFRNRMISKNLFCFSISLFIDNAPFYFFHLYTLLSMKVDNIN